MRKGSIPVLCVTCGKQTTTWPFKLRTQKTFCCSKECAARNPYKASQASKYMLENNPLLDPEVKEKIRQASIGRTPWNKGLDITHPSIKKQAEKHIGHPLYSGSEKGWFTTERTYDAKNVNWKGGEGRFKHRGYHWEKIRKQVLERDGHKCVRCSNSTRRLHVHHINEWTPETQDNSIDNLETLCISCHISHHKNKREAES